MPHDKLISSLANTGIILDPFSNGSVTITPTRHRGLYWTALQQSSTPVSSMQGPLRIHTWPSPILHIPEVYQLLHIHPYNYADDILPYKPRKLFEIVTHWHFTDFAGGMAILCYNNYSAARSTRKGFFLSGRPWDMQLTSCWSCRASVSQSEHIQGLDLYYIKWANSTLDTHDHDFL